MGTMMRMLSTVVATTIVLSALVHQGACKAVMDKKELVSAELATKSADLGVTSAPAVVDNDKAPLGDQLTPMAVASGRAADSGEDDSESRKQGIKIKKKPKLKKSKKFLKKILPLLLIPLLIQAKLIPLFIFKLKLLALKAFGIGKLALILILINVIYNAMHGAQNMDQQYSKEVLANEHYGYNGGPEYGAWVNKRLYSVANS